MQNLIEDHTLIEWDMPPVQPPKISSITHFFCLCSGADRRVLQECPTEYTKYVGIGATLFFTGVLATISGGFAIATITQNVALVIIFALLWGLMIFNLDRYIVSSMRKEGNKWREVALAVPRLLLAGVISVVITKPLEVQLFKPQITYQLAQIEEQRLLQSQKIYYEKYNLQGIEEKMKDLQNRKDSLLQISQQKPKAFAFEQLENQLKEAEKKLRLLKNNEKNESLRKDLTLQIENLKQQKQDWLQNYLSNFQVEIQRNEQLIAQLQANRLEADSAARADALKGKKIIGGYGIGILAELEALETLKKQSEPMWWASWSIVLLLLIIETAPVMVKIISKKGLYDETLARFEYESYLYNERKKRQAQEKYEQDLRQKNAEAILQQNLISAETVGVELPKKNTITGKMWEIRGHNPRITYHFKKSSPHNELIYIQNDIVQYGTWELENDIFLRIYLDKVSTTYKICELTANKLIIQDVITGLQLHLSETSVE
jgi:hypothetical protein